MTEVNRQAQAVAEASLRAAIANQRTDALIASSRALLAQSRQLLADLEHAEALRTPRRVSPRESVVVSSCEGTAVGPTVHRNDHTSAQHTELSIRVLKEAEQFGWTLYSPTKVMLGWGTAQTEFKARVDALHAGMTPICAYQHSAPLEFSVGGAVHQGPIHQINHAQKPLAVSDCLQRIGAQALYIVNGRAGLLNYFSVFFCHGLLPIKSFVSVLIATPVPGGRQLNAIAVCELVQYPRRHATSRKQARAAS